MNPERITLTVVVGWVRILTVVNKQTYTCNKTAEKQAKPNKCEQD